MPDMNFTGPWVTSALLGVLTKTAPVVEGSFRSVQTDSRLLQPGDLFVCIRGERFDGHAFARQAADAGAQALVVDAPINVDLPQYVVTNTRQALGALALAWRKQFPARVVAVVGSNGKTTTKEMLASIAKAHFGESQVLATHGNLNNDIGVPHTLFQLRAHHRVAVVEVGMNHPGEIEELARVVRPDVAVLTNAQREHQEFMHTVEAVAYENGSVFKHLEGNGVAIVPQGTAFDAVWESLALGHRVVRFGAAGDVNYLRDGASFFVRTYEGIVRIVPAFLGEHNIQNATAAAAAASVLGCNLESIRSGLECFEPVHGRLQVVLRSSALILVDDTYNANPDSVNAASAVLVGLGRPGILVLGDMGEVGEQSALCHAEVGEVARRLGVTQLLTFGTASRHASRAFGQGALHFETIEQLTQHIMTTLQQGPGAVLVKGSRFMKMERVVHAICAALQHGHGGPHVA